MGNDERVKGMGEYLSGLTEEDFEVDDMVEKTACVLCGDTHIGEVYLSSPDGYYIRYWCPDREMMLNRSFG